ncbi:MAG: hypothetical protein L3J39_09000 [Verrucomicrobiales bacterium]|nr:hypothetical protein [Verrucomicrobiales bacterium]
MKKSLPIIITIIALLASLGQSTQAQDFAQECERRAQSETANVRGDDPAWFFMKRELKQLALGKFWEKDWSKVAANKADPTEHLLMFHDLLKAKGVRLIMVPIPAKAAIYPDKLAAKFKPGSATAVKAYYDTLRAKGLEVLDVEPVLNKYRAESGGEGEHKLYCEQDSHFAPLTAEIIASLVKKAVADDAWYQAQSKDEFKRSAKESLSIRGDQVGEFSPTPEEEVLTLTYAGKEVGGKIEAVAAYKNSPVLLLGDSHTMVFTDGAQADMHCKSAGLQDQLQYELGFALDRVSNKGSGIMQARKSLVLMRVRNEPGFWDKKKLVIWVFSAREFTQSSDKMRKLPIEVPRK